jgi:hypothetical protein
LCPRARHFGLSFPLYPLKNALKTRHKVYLEGNGGVETLVVQRYSFISEKKYIYIANSIMLDTRQKSDVVNKQNMASDDLDNS